MSDPRNVAHAKKVTQEKVHHPESGSRPRPKKDRKTAAAQNDAAESKPAPAEVAKVEQAPGELEKSVAVLSKLKDMEFHSRANIEALAGLILTISMVGAVIIARRQTTTDLIPVDASIEIVSPGVVFVDDNPHTIPVTGADRPQAKAYPEK